MRSMLRTTFGIIGLSIFCPCIFGQQPQSEQQPPAVTNESEITTADGGSTDGIRFEISDEPQKLQLFRADPALLEQKYVAIVEMKGVPQLGPYVRQNVMQKAEQVYLDAFYGRGSLLFMRTTHSASHQGKQGAAFIADLTKKVPPKESISQDVLGFFHDAEKIDGGYLQFFWNTNRPQYEDRTFRFTILAPNNQIAKDRAEALVMMLRVGFKEPLLRALKKEEGYLQTLLDTMGNRIEEHDQAIKRITREIEKLPDIEGEELSRLKTEQRLTDVELAGLRARVEAAEGIIARMRSQSADSPNSLADRLGRVEGLKIDAEIGIAGMLARQQALNKLIEIGHDRRGKYQKRLVKRREANVVRKEVDRIRDRAKNLLVAIEAAAQTFEVHNGHVRIAPIEWTK